jgi:hypothetical protein
MTEHAPERIWSTINIPKTLAGTLAAVTAAVLGSFLGVAGTLVGAAVASIVGSVGTEIYQHWIARSQSKLRSTFVTAPAAVGTPPVVAAEEEKAPEKVRWGRVGLVAASVFLLAMGALTAFELATGKSAADAVGNSTSSTTTIGSVFGGNDSDKTPVPATSEQTPTPDATESAVPAETTAPETVAPTSEAPTSAPTTATPTEQPTTGAPAEETQGPPTDGSE